MDHFISGDRYRETYDDAYADDRPSAFCRGATAAAAAIIAGLALYGVYAIAAGLV